MPLAEVPEMPSRQIRADATAEAVPSDKEGRPNRRVAALVFLKPQNMLALSFDQSLNFWPLAVGNASNAKRFFGDSKGIVVP